MSFGDEKSWPELSGLGEAVKAALLAIHKVNAEKARRSQATAHGFRQNCLLMNEIAAALCNRQ